MRAAGSYRVDSVVYKDERNPRALRRNPDVPRLSRKVSEHISLTRVDCIIEPVAVNMQIVRVEFAENARALTAEEQHRKIDQFKTAAKTA